MSYVDTLELQPVPSVTLVVGDMKSWLSKGCGIPEIDGYYFSDISDITSDFIGQLAPEVVLSSLVGSNFDAVEIAKKLQQINFTGSYRILTRNVPNLDLIIAEVRNVAPLIDVDIIDLAFIFPNL